MKRQLISSYELKHAFQSLLNPAKEFLINHGVTANTITLCSFFFTLILVFGLTQLELRPVFLLLAPLFMLLKISCNALDGLVARETNQRTTLGAWLNESTDIVADLLVIGALYAISPKIGYDWILLLIMILLIETIGLLSQVRHGNRQHFGPFSKSDRAIFASSLALVLWVNPDNTVIISIITWLGLLLALITLLQHLLQWLAE